MQVITLDGKAVWRRRHYRVRRAEVPGTFHFSVLDNGVISKEFWRIVHVTEDLSWGLFYYAGAASVVGQAYRGQAEYVQLKCLFLALLTSFLSSCCWDPLWKTASNIPLINDTVFCSMLHACCWNRMSVRCMRAAMLMLQSMLAMVAHWLKAMQKMPSA